MSYTVNKKNGTITINEGQLNTETSLELVGKDYFGYGQSVAQSFINLLQNQASDTAPTDPIEGQLWYDTTNTVLYIWDTTGSTDAVGRWLTVSTMSEQRTVKDTMGIDHLVYIIQQNGSDVVAMSTEANFDVNINDAVYSTFPKIKTGLTLTNQTGAKFHGIATSAEYADLAEMYASDKEYEPGTVVMLGGSAEITECANENCTEVFGVVSTEPAYLMNSALEGTGSAVALSGRVPCKVIGPVTKGQRLVVSSTPGVAKASDTSDWKCIIGRALEDKATQEVDVIEVVVGVK